MKSKPIARKNAKGDYFPVLCVIVILSCMVLFPPTSAESISRNVTITANIVDSIQAAQFKADIISNTPLVVKFTLMSGAANSWVWDFGDGSSTTTVRDPLHTYTTSGTYIVSLTVWDIAKNSQKVSMTIPRPLLPPTAPDTGSSDNGAASQAAPSDGISGNVGTQAIDSHGIDLSVNGLSIAAGSIVTVNGNLVTITTPTFTLVYTTGKLTESKGVLTSQDVGSMTLTTESVEADIPGVGEVSGSVEAGIESISSDNATVNITLAKPETKDILAFSEALKKAGQDMDAVAFTMTVTKANITANLPAKITMTVPPDWVARNGGLSAVSIMRTADDGTTQVLPTTFVGIDFKTGNLVFEGFSKDGLSVFGLVTAKASAVEQAEQPNTTVVAVSKPAMSTNVGMYAWLMGIVEQNPVIIVIVLVIVALIAYLGWWRRRL